MLEWGDQKDQGVSPSTEEQDLCESSLYSGMEKDAKRHVDFIKSDKRFYCEYLGRITSPKRCAEGCYQGCSCSSCSGCMICRTARTIFVPESKKQEHPFMEQLRETVEQEAETAKSKDTSKDTNFSASLEGFQFNVHNPRSVSRCWRPSEPCVSLTKQVLYINTEAIRRFDLSGQDRVALLYDYSNDAMLLDFTEDYPEYMKLAVSQRRKSGDAKVSLIGFRKNFGLQLVGKFRLEQCSYGNEKYLIRLDQKMDIA